MAVAQRTYEEIALEEPHRRWELYRGKLRGKPEVSVGRSIVQRRLARTLHINLDPERFVVSVDASRVRRVSETSFIPDICVIPETYQQAYRGRWEALEVYADPLPLVIEVWSPSTGEYDVESKLPEYLARGDLEIWRAHPFERTLTSWRTRPDGSYDEVVFRSGVVEPVALPGVRIDLDALFA